MLHHLLSFTLLLIGMSLLVWHANQSAFEFHGARTISAPLVTKILSVIVVGVCLFLVPEIAENIIQKIIGYVLVGLGFAACIKVITTRIIISDEAISETSVYGMRRIYWDDIEGVRSSRIDPAFVILGRDGCKIKVHYLFNGAIQFERELKRKTESR